MNLNISDPSTLLQSNDIESISLIAVPIHVFQNSNSNSFIIDQNLLFKSLPDGTLILNTNELLNSNLNLNLTSDISTNGTNIEKSSDNIEPVLDISEPCNILDNLQKPIDNTINQSVEVHENINATTDIVNLQPNTEIVSKCRFCEKEFQKQYLLKRHEKSHLSEKKFKCNLCPATYNILSNHLLHLAIHNTENPTCPECGKKFQRIASLKAHMKYHEKDENFYCDDCDLLFNNEIDMNEHLKEHDHEKKEETENLQCKYCRHKFTIQKEYKKHMSDHSKVRNILHKNNKHKKKTRKTKTEKNHQCDICSKSFQKLSQIERHMRVHSGEKPYICKICNRGFSQKGSLQIHMTKHTGLKPHKCALCQAKFSQKGNLRVHILKTHSFPRGEENMFSCLECPCVFKKLGSLNSHMTRNHPKQKTSDINYIMSQLTAIQGNTSTENDILQEAILKSDLPEMQTEKLNEATTSQYVTLTDMTLDGKVRRYVIRQRKANNIRWHSCSYCTKEFKKPSDLIRHFRVHTREKPYTCKLCRRSFAIKSVLTTHIKTHSKVTKVQCPHCLKFFSSWTSLNAHIVTHTAPKFKCTVCNKCFRSTDKLNEHSQLHSNNQNSVLKNKSSSSDIMLQPIQITNNGIQTVLSMRKRPLAEAGSKSRPHSCKECGAAFRRLSHLKQHHFKHTGEKPFKCSLCLRSFASNGILKTHLLTHKSIKSFQCLICQKNFSTNSSLKRHLESHSTTKPFICPYCFKDFKNILQCRKHMTTHVFDLNLQTEENEEFADIIEKSLPYPPNLEDTLTEDPFSLTESLNKDSFIKEKQIDTIETPPPLISQGITRDQSDPIVLPIISKQDNITQGTMQEMEDTLNSEILNIVGAENFTNPAEFIDKVNISETIATNDELVNTLTDNTPVEKSIDENPFLYHPVIVNLNPEPEQIPLFENNSADILSQVKLPNESLFLTDINSLNINTVNVNETNNVLLPFQIATQPELNQNQLIILPSEIDSQLQTNTFTSTENLDGIDQSLQLNVMNGFLNSIPNLTETNVILNNTGTETTSEFLNSEAVTDLLPNLAELSEKPVDNNLITNIIGENNQILAIISDTPININDYSCNLCKINFKSRNELKSHKCVNMIEEINKLKNNKNNAVDSISLNIESTSDTTPEVTHLYKNVCSFCSKSFRKPSDLQRHIRTHTGERPYKCNECSKSFSLKSTLENHVKMHEGKKEFVCQVCNCLFATKGSLNVHMRLHTGAKPFKCPICPLKFRTSGHSKAHLTVHYKEALKTGKISSDLSARKGKMNEFIEEIQKIINEENNQKNKLEDINQTIPEVDNNIVLQSNEKQLMHFQIETNNQGHIVNVKPTPTNIVCVDETSKTEIVSTQLEFNDKVRLQIEEFLQEKRAKKLAAKNRNKKVCKICEKEFGSKFLLDRHNKIHTGERIFSCTYCTKAFNQKNALQSHIRTHLDTRPYSCPYCLNSFNHSGNLKTHIKRIHGNLGDKIETTLISG